MTRLSHAKNQSDYGVLAQFPWYGMAALAVVTLSASVYIRWRVFAIPRAFWLDEAFIASVVSSKSSLADFLSLTFSTSIGRPIGYLMLNRAVIDALGNDELILRGLSVASACLSMIALAFLLWKVFRSLPIVLIGTLLWGFTNELVIYAAHFKPYLFEAFLNVVLLALTIHAFEMRTRGAWVGTLSFAIIVAWFSVWSLLVIPIPFIAAAWEMANGRPILRRSTFVALCTLQAISLAYLFFRYYLPGLGEFNGLFERDYGSYFTGPPGDYPLWLYRKLSAMIGAFIVPDTVSHGLLRRYGEAVATGAVRLFFAVGLLGAVYAISARRLAWVLIALLPIALIVLLNAFHSWPLGRDRWNIPAALHLLLLFLMGVHAIARFTTQSVAVVAALCAWLIFFPVKSAYYADTYWVPDRLLTQNVPQALSDASAIAMQRIGDSARPIAIVLSHGARAGFDYYTTYHADASRNSVLRRPPFKFMELLSADSQAVQVSMKEAAAHSLALVVVSHYSEEELTAVATNLNALCQSVERRVYVGTQLFACHGRR